MISIKRERGWRAVLLLVLTASLLLLLVAAGAHHHAPPVAMCVLLPLFLFGEVVLLGLLLWRAPADSSVHSPSIARPSLFQRPPPFLLA